mgnify:CR=1 FL=1
MTKAAALINRIKGFTIIELLVVIVIVGILATISIIGYGSWRTSVISAQVKSDLNAAASAMESSRTFGNGYPLTLPSTVVPSTNVSLTLTPSSTALAYCIDGVSNENTSDTFYVASESKDQGALSGTCATRPATTPPAVPGSIAVNSTTTTTIALTWAAASYASTYLAECSTDAGFTNNVKQATTAGLAATVTGLTTATSYFCHVRAVNSLGSSAWSSMVSANTATPPLAPAGFAVVSKTNIQINFSWSTVTGATSYMVTCATDTGYTQNSRQASTAATTVAVTGLLPGRLHYCKVVATNSSGTSPSSLVLQVTTNGWSMLSAGYSGTTCGLRANVAYCWGLNTNGQLGNGNTTTIDTPVAVDVSGALIGKKVTAISANGSHTCAVADGKAYCWGSNTYGQIGDNTTTPSSLPVAVDMSGALSGKTVTDISVGNGFSCAVASGAVYCWGYNANGRLGINSTTDSLVAVAVNTAGVLSGKTVTSANTGNGANSNACVVASGLGFCWGLNGDGELGNGLSTQSLVPVAVNTAGVLSGKTVTAISVGGTSSAPHTCAVASGAAYCWGKNSKGSLGNNSSSTSSLVPIAVDATGVLAGKTVTDISAGYQHSCVVASGQAYCWGNALNGRLGNNSTTSPVIVPVAVDVSGVLAGKTVTQITTGNTYSCAVADGSAYCWGSAASGQLGNDTTSGSYLVPTAIIEP